MSRSVIRMVNQPFLKPADEEDLSLYVCKLLLPVSPSALGMLVVIVLKILTKTRKTVTSSVILPGTISGGTKKLIHETITNMPEGR